MIPSTRRRASLLQLDGRRRSRIEPGPAPIVVAVDPAPATRAAVSDGVRLARELDAPVIFVYVRRGPSAVLGEPYHQRRLDAEMAVGNRVLDAALAVAKRAGVAASGEQLHGNPARRLAEFARIREARLVVLGSRRRRLGKSSTSSDGYRVAAESALAPIVQATARRQAWSTTTQGGAMPYGVYPVPKYRAAGEFTQTGPSLDVRISTRIRRSRLDSRLAHGADSAANAELALRAAQLRSTAERARIANRLVETLGDARRGEPMTLMPRPQRSVVRDAADDILALALRLREDGPVGIEGVARAALLVDGKTSPMYRADAGDLRHAIRSALSALDATREQARDLHARAA